MALREVDGAAGAPWELELRGTLDTLVVESELLAGNPLGDPARRPLYVYSSPGVAGEPVPSVYVIMGFTGQLDMWFNRPMMEPTMFERLDAMFDACGCPDAVIAFVDAWTSVGGSQYVNSDGTGPYMDHLCDEPFVDERYPTLAGRDHRGLTGKSSGGYGAMVVPMLRPHVFGALASHAGDALFEACLLPDFPAIARQLRDDFEGSWDVYFDRLAETDHFDFAKVGKPFEMNGYAVAYTPDPDRPGRGVMPFEISRARQARRGPHARAVRRQAGRAHLPLSGRDPRAAARTHRHVVRAPPAPRPRSRHREPRAPPGWRPRP